MILVPPLAPHIDRVNLNGYEVRFRTQPDVDVTFNGGQVIIVSEQDIAELVGLPAPDQGADE